MILVTGGAGYLGSHFVRRYCALHPKDKLIVVDDLSQGHEEALAELPAVEFKKENIGDYEAMTALFSKYEVSAVVHFAASINVNESHKNPNKYFQNNVVNTLSLFRAMEDCHIRKIIFSSTCAVYGYPQYVPMDENHPQCPVSVYGRTKMMIESALAAYADASNWSYITLRYFNACGANENGLTGESHHPETHIIPIALMAASGRLESMQIYGDDYDTADGTCVRDYVHVIDLADAHIQALKLLSNQKGGDVINLGTAHGASVKEVIDVCNEVTGIKIPYRITSRRAGDPPYLVADAKKAALKLNWQPRYNLRKIIETAWYWEKNRRF